MSQWPRRELPSAGHRAPRQERAELGSQVTRTLLLLENQGASRVCVRFFHCGSAQASSTQDSRFPGRQGAEVPDPGEFTSENPAWQPSPCHCPRARAHSDSASRGDSNRCCSQATPRPQAAEAQGHPRNPLPRASVAQQHPLGAAETLPARGSCERSRREGACAPRAGSGALWEARAFAASANMAAP